MKWNKFLCWLFGHEWYYWTDTRMKDCDRCGIREKWKNYPNI